MCYLHLPHHPPLAFTVIIGSVRSYDLKPSSRPGAAVVRLKARSYQTHIAHPSGYMTKRLDSFYTRVHEQKKGSSLFRIATLRAHIVGCDSETGSSWRSQQCYNGVHDCFWGFPRSTGRAVSIEKGPTKTPSNEAKSQDSVA